MAQTVSITSPDRPGLPDFSRETLKNMGTPGYEANASWVHIIKLFYIPWAPEKEETSLSYSKWSYKAILWVSFQASIEFWIVVRLKGVVKLTQQSTGFMIKHHCWCDEAMSSSDSEKQSSSSCLALGTRLVIAMPMWLCSKLTFVYTYICRCSVLTCDRIVAECNICHSALTANDYCTNHVALATSMLQARVLIRIKEQAGPVANL